ncbi:hypothetical protein ACT3WC_18610, partial [Klebsiella pneumoniae]
MLEQMGIAAKAASWQLALLSSREKNQVLEKIADYLEAQTDDIRHCCKVSDEAAFCLIQRPYISKTLLTRRISPR